MLRKQESTLKTKPERILGGPCWQGEEYFKCLLGTNLDINYFRSESCVRQGINSEVPCWASTRLKANTVKHFATRQRSLGAHSMVCSTILYPEVGCLCTWRFHLAIMMTQH